MSYTCGDCQYTTSNKWLYQRHCSKARSCSDDAGWESKTTYDCSKCSKEYKTPQALKTHEKTCDGVHPLQCKSCSTLFSDRHAKSRHVKKGCTGASAGATTSSNTTVGNGSIVQEVQGSNNTTTQTIVNINCTPAQKEEIVSFMNTDLEAVVQLVIKDPSRFQLALQSGCLHQELCRATHFGTIEKNRNIVSIENKGTKMKVMHKSVATVMDKTDGIRQIMTNNHKIATSDKAVKYLGVDGTKSTSRKVKSQLSNVVLNNGEYVTTFDFDDLVPRHLPPQKNYVELLTDFEENLEKFYQLDEYGLLVPSGVKACEYMLCFMQDPSGTRAQCWEAIPERTGWARCTDVASTVSDCLADLVSFLTTSIMKRKSTAMEQNDQDTMWQCKDVFDALRVLQWDSFVKEVAAKFTQ